MLSYTAIKTYLDCPRQYFYRYVEGRKTLPSPVMEEGIEEHKKIAETGEVPAFFRPAFEKHFLNPVFEEHLQVDFLTFDLQGYIDCYSINNDLFCAIADWKLMSIPEEDDQLKLYALLLSEKYPDLAFFTTFFVSIKGGFYKRYTYSRDDIEEFRERLFRIVEEIHKDKEFNPKPGRHCGFCPFIKDCYEKYQITADVSTVAISSVEEARELAKKVMIAEGFLKQVKEQLKAFLIENGLEELDIDKKNRVYLSPSVALRFGRKR